MGRLIGIDLGTTNIVVAADVNGVKCLPNADGTYLTPAAVCFLNPQETLLGTDAKDNEILAMDRTVTMVKRLVGVTDHAITVDGQAYSPQQIDALLLKRVKKDAEDYLGEEVDAAVITVPAYFDAQRIEATKEAGYMAGFKEIYIIDEPEATMYAMGDLKEYEDCLVVIFDEGGGTTDAVAIKTSKDTYEELVIGGDNYCGGADQDKAVMEYVCENKLKGVTLDGEGKQELLRKVEDAKKRLSKAEEVHFTIMTSEGRTEVGLTREELNSCIKPHVEKALKVLAELLDKLETKGYAKVDYVLLCGGATRVPLFMEMVRELCPGVEIRAKDVDEAVAKGAYIYGQALQQENQPYMTRQNAEYFGNIKRLKRVSSRSYGIKVHVHDDSHMVSNMILQNEPIPASKKEVYFTKDENQKKVLLAVYESTDDKEMEELENAVCIGDCVLEIGVDLKKGSPIEVEMLVREDGTLFIRGHEKTSGAEVKSYMKTKALLSEEEFAQEKQMVDAICEIMD